MYNSIFYDFRKNQPKTTNFSQVLSIICLLLLLTSYLGFANTIPKDSFSPNAETNILGDPCSWIWEKTNYNNGYSSMSLGGTDNGRAALVLL